MAGDTQFCEQCGTPIPEGVAFCESCGTAVPAAVTAEPTAPPVAVAAEPTAPPVAETPVVAPLAPEPASATTAPVAVAPPPPTTRRGSFAWAPLVIGLLGVLLIVGSIVSAR